MLNHLFATILICLGVANTTPISNCDHKESNLVLTTPKKQNETTQYTMDISISGYTSQTYTSNTPIANSYYPTSQERIGIRWTMNGNNPYLNVLGSIYKQRILTQVQGTDAQENPINTYADIVMNQRILQNQGYNYLYQKRAELLYAMQITPYKFNVETEMELRINIDITEWENQNGIEWYNYEIYLLRNIYQSTSYTNNPIDQTRTYDFEQYIGQQVTEYQAYNIARDIENIDNGFYYTKTQDLIQIGNNTMHGQVYTDEIQINIVPEINNYYVIEYIPCVKVVEMGADQSLEIVVPQIGYTTYPVGPLRISGTNIIPSGVYEVIDIPGLMFEVIGMPFAFVSQAFNLTLFPGTPYQINIANLFLSIAAIFIFVWLLLLFIKMKG